MEKINHKSNIIDNELEQVFYTSTEVHDDYILSISQGIKNSKAHVNQAIEFKKTFNNTGSITIIPFGNIVINKNISEAKITIESNISNFSVIKTFLNGNNCTEFNITDHNHIKTLIFEELDDAVVITIKSDVVLPLIDKFLFEIAYLKDITEKNQLIELMNLLNENYSNMIEENTNIKVKVLI